MVHGISGVCASKSIILNKTKMLTMSDRCDVNYIHNYGIEITHVMIFKNEMYCICNIVWLILGRIHDESVFAFFILIMKKRNRRALLILATKAVVL